MTPIWNPDDYKKPSAKQFIRELNLLADEYALHVEGRQIYV